MKYTLFILILSTFNCVQIPSYAEDSLGQEINELESKSGVYPDPALTPGDTDPAVTQDTIKETICKHGYTKTVRNVTSAMKKEVFAEYKIKDHFGDYEVDHFISLELGGSNAIKNLWPESYKIEWNARKKDVVETYLGHEICQGRISLLDAQKAIREDWVKVYKQRSGEGKRDLAHTDKVPGVTNQERTIMYPPSRKSRPKTLVENE